MTSDAGSWRRAAARFGALALALACGRADDGQRPSLPIEVQPSLEAEPAAPEAPSPNDSSTSDDDSHDAGASLASGNGAECPAPRREAVPANAPGWARDPATGTCCPYANRNAAPNGWLRFDDEDACKTRCLCSALEGFEGAFENLLAVPDSLECRCSIESCPSTVAEAEQTSCAETWPLGAVQRLVGCGMVVVIDRNGFSGHAWIFEQPSASGDAGPPAARLVGASLFSDASTSDACPSSSWSAGRDFFAECDDAEVVACQLCGDSPGTEYPPCQ